MTYKESGVDVDMAAALVERIRPLAASTKRNGVIGTLGGFGGLFDLSDFALDAPVLVAATDGVGTKLEIAIAVGCHNTVGVDLVAMCINDIVVQGARPLFFLDYFATGRLDADVAFDVISGIAEGCRQAGCALIGGETAEMPGMYQGSDYDLAGFAVGLVERSRLLPGGNIAAGDILLGLCSSGIHSNGLSLVRHILRDRGIDYSAATPRGDGRTWGQELLTPTRIYSEACLALHQEAVVKGFCHITGGGLLENLPRILPEGLSVVLEASNWPDPWLFRWLRREGGVAVREMTGTFNCGIGMIAVVAPEHVDRSMDILRRHGHDVRRIGKIGAASDCERVSITDLEIAWAN